MFFFCEVEMLRVNFRGTKVVQRKDLERFRNRREPTLTPRGMFWYVSAIVVTVHSVAIILAVVVVKQ
jgi:hypothetical protein